MTNKLKKYQYSPSLFDTTQDIIGTLPLKLIAKWMESEQTQEIAQQLLEPYKVKGYSVSSDSVGLTKLTKQRGLLEILAIINQPKEILYGFGIALGGYSVGIWAADNTQMFYPASVNSETLLSALLTIQGEISKNCQIKIGIGAHYGDFYYINGGLYGLEADTIEEITENQTEGGEIAISQGFYERLPSNHNFSILQRDEVKTIIGNMFRVLDGPTLSNVPPGNKQYPIPYSEPFYADLIAYQNRQNDPVFRQYLADKYLQNKVVVLIERENKDAAAREIFMFTNLGFSAKMKDIGLRLLAQSNGEEIKVIGSLGIYTFDEATAAFNFAQAFRYELAAQDIASRIGIDAGQVLISDLAVGGKDIAGMPVNIASKMAQDKGEFGKLYVNATIKQLVDLSEFTEISYTVSGVEITAYQG
ncbi:family 3 adenylate cyclase [Cylindrospermum sp. FACHB-282]|uniref:family 3 adenylate cyclase n=1 Tax=Cylindrospermum sp. FACHB-282 TaxID=2692794 RepID=UPI001684637E|nr:family 3 adenylate cyclase [Cylindrospermum sp. FACHB-282]MBD2387980.1 family 3 adenylate cyclase [Cylindrospermum sp. FACHB-282]